MKKIIISGSSKLQKEVKYWCDYFKDKGYKILDYPRKVERYNLAETYIMFYRHIENTDALFVMNEENGYIGPSAFAELTYAVMQNKNHNKNIDIYILNMPSNEHFCYDEIKLFLEQGWIKLFPNTKVSKIDLISDLKYYFPFNEQERKDKELFLKEINKYSRYTSPIDFLLKRESKLVHFSSTAFVVNKTRDKVLVVNHNILDGWIYPGGHADGEEDLLSVAIREVEEETGVKAKALDNSIFSIQAIPIPSHIKRDKPVLAHTHLDVIYLLEADDAIPLTIKPDENSGVKWLPLNELAYDGMVNCIKPVHKKLVDKLTKNIDIYS